MEIDDEELLVEDLLALKLGEIIPVDGILVSSYYIITDESDLIKNCQIFLLNLKMERIILYSLRALKL